MIRGTEDRARTALKKINEEGYSIRQACKECNISKAFLKDFERKQFRIKKFENLVEQVKLEKKQQQNPELVIGDMPELDAPVIKFEEDLDLQLEEEETKMEQQQDLFTNAAQHEQAMSALKIKFEHDVNLAMALAKYRYSKKMTQDEFAKSCGIGASTLAQYESGVVEISTVKRQVRMVYARINMTEEELIEKWANKNVAIPFKKDHGFDNIRRNVAVRLDYMLPELVEETNLEATEENEPIVEASIVKDNNEAKVKDLESQIEELKAQNKHISSIQQGSDKRRVAVEKENEALEQQIASLKGIVKEKDDLITSLRNELSVARQPDVKANKESLEIIQAKDAKIKELQRTIKRYELIIDRQFVGAEA